MIGTKTLRLTTVAMLVALGAVLAVLALSAPAVGAQENEEGNTEEAAAAYQYVAQPGDSYALMARKAVQTYGIDNDVNLSAAGIIYAETQLTLAADSPELNVGQEVSIDESTVREWVEKADELSEADEAAWAVYAEGVDFNTDHVGEARE